MDAKTRDVVRECARASGEGRISFGEVVSRLTGAGVERYHADYVRGDTTYYLPHGETEIVPLHTTSTAPAKTFSVAGMQAAVRGAQSGTLKYPEFCERALEAGCVGYIVSILGRRVVYYGRTGDTHVEWFPGSP